MESIRLKGRRFLVAAVFLTLGGLIGISSMKPATALGTYASAADGAHRGASALAAPSRTFSTALVNGSAEEQVDPVEDRDQAPAGLVVPSLAPVEASSPPAFGLSPLARSTFVDSTPARGPPSA
jgi:hypothetical protein